MSSSAEAAVSELVTRFIELRRVGRRESVDRLLDQAAELPDRPTVRNEVLRRISLHARAAGLGGSSAEAGIDGETREPHDLPELEGYYVIDEVGRGGMGAVYEAYQQSTGRRVALKFLLPSAHAAEPVRRRFEREVELIARLQHPNIVSVVDSGIHRGRYFFAMDYVEGRRLDEAISPGQGDVRPTLALISTVSAAVDYAHQRGVLHRDLKPSNVLIDDAGQPHIVDFGLAKAIESDSAGRAEFTLSEPGQLLGTLAYMPPEQSRGRLDEISVRSDVYSLGAMAYELLTGRLPCSLDGPLQVVLGRIAEQPAARPSLFRHELDADIDAVLLKALEKSPNDRYATAGDFAADLNRYLAGDPVTARPTGQVRRAVRAVKRHRGVALVSGLALLVVSICVTAAFVQVRAERDRALLAEAAAREEARRTDRVKGFLQESLGYVDPDVARSADARFVDQLDHAAAQVGPAFAGYPLEEAEVRHTLGHYYAQRSFYEKAENELRRALAVRRAQLGEDHLDTAASMYELAGVLHAMDGYDEAERLYRQALQTYRNRYGDRSREAAAVMNDLAWLLKDRGRYQESEPLYQQALSLRRESLGPDHPDVAETLNDLAHVYYALHDAKKAEPLFREALTIRQNPSEGEKSYVKIAATMASLGGVLTRLDRTAEAEPLLREALDIRRRLLGDEHADTIVSMNELGLLLRGQGRYVEAEELLREALRLRKVVYGPAHSKVAVSLVNLGLVLQARRQCAEAHGLYDEALRIWRDELRLGDHDNVAAVLSHLANLLREVGRYEEAERYGREALEMRTRLSTNDPSNAAIGDAKALVGRIMLERGDAQGAEPLLRDGLAILREKRSPEHGMTVRTQVLLGACRQTLGRYSEAEQDLAAAFTVMNKKRPSPDPDTLDLLRRLISVCEAQGKSSEAEAYRALLRSPDASAVDSGGASAEGNERGQAQ